MNPGLALAILFNGVLAGSCGYALWRGGFPERTGAVTNIVAACLTTALRLVDPSYYAPVSVVIFAIDVGVLASFWWLAIKTTRFWPVWAFGFALADIVVSIAGMVLPRTPLVAYHMSVGIYAYLALGALALGAYRLPRDATPEQRRGLRPRWKVPTQT